MSHFCLLKDPDSYRAHDLDLVADEELRNYWLDLFATHFEKMLAHAAERYGRAAGKRIEAARQNFNEIIDQLRESPRALESGKLNVMELGRVRDEVLAAQKLGDPYSFVKQKDNAAALEMYPDVVHRLHRMADEEKWRHLVRCVFAGNLFDTGSAAAMQEAESNSDFLEVEQKIKPRPWLVDDYDLLEGDLLMGPPPKWGKCVIFVDNAGSDFMLGVMPFARELALQGTKVVVAANETPVLNDITADEAVEAVESLAAVDPDLVALIQGEMFEVVSTGNRLALIDLSEVSDELNEAAVDADFVLLEGMGRAVESNFDAEFSVDSLHLALLKDPQVAARVGGEMYDCIGRYSPVEVEGGEGEQGAETEQEGEAPARGGI